MTMTTYTARVAYEIDPLTRDGRPLIIGKVVDAGSAVIFLRDEPLEKALLRKRDAFSIDERALDQWALDGVTVIHFGDKGGTTVWAISCADFVRLSYRREHGAGWQRYVAREHFSEIERFYKATRTGVIRRLDPLPVAWEPLAAPMTRAERAAASKTNPSQTGLGI